jgi:hypothetical protein
MPTYGPDPVLKLSRVETTQFPFILHIHRFSLIYFLLAPLSNRVPKNHLI